MNHTSSSSVPLLPRNMSKRGGEMAASTAVRGINFRINQTKNPWQTFMRQNFSAVHKKHNVTEGPVPAEGIQSGQ